MGLGPYPNLPSLPFCTIAIEVKTLHIALSGLQAAFLPSINLFQGQFFSHLRYLSFTIRHFHYVLYRSLLTDLYKHLHPSIFIYRRPLASPPHERFGDVTPVLAVLDGLVVLRRLKNTVGDVRLKLLLLLVVGALRELHEVRGERVSD